MPWLHRYISQPASGNTAVQPSRYCLFEQRLASRHERRAVDVTGILYHWSVIILSEYVQHLSTRLMLHGCNMRVRALQGDSAVLLRTFAHASKTTPPIVYYLWIVLVATCGQETDIAVHSQRVPLDDEWHFVGNMAFFFGTKTLNQIKPTLYTFGKHHIPLVMFYIILYLGHLHFIMLWLPKCVQWRNIKW